MRIEDLALDAHLRDPALLPARPTEGKQYITCYDPATAFHLDTLVADDATSIAHKIELASKAQVAWGQSSFADRRKVMRSLKKWLVDNQETCAKVAARDTGKTREEC